MYFHEILYGAIHHVTSLILKVSDWYTKILISSSSIAMPVSIAEIYFCDSNYDERSKLSNTRDVMIVN